MKKITLLILTIGLLAANMTPALSVPVGNNVEYVPATRNLGLGVIDPAAKLEVNGQVMITGGNPQAGYVLTSDSRGLATWTELSVLASNINGAVASAISATKLVAPDGSPDPAFSVDNDGNLISAGGNIYVPNNVTVGIDRPDTSPRAISWDNQGTLIRDTGHVDFFADDNSDNSDVGFKFYVNAPDRNSAKFVASITDQGTIMASRFVGDGSMLTGITFANVSNATNANVADFATAAGTATTATTAVNVSNISNGTINNSVILGGVINGTHLVNVDLSNTNFLDSLYEWKLVHVEDFDSTVTGWSTNTTTTCGSHKILGGYNVAGGYNAVGKATNLSTNFDLTGIPHTHVMLRYNFFSIDSYDKEYGILKLDGEHAWSRRFHNDDADRKHICGQNSNQYYFRDLIVTGEAMKEHSSDTLNVEFSSTLNETLDNESFGIDNLEIWVRVPLSPVPELPTGTPPTPPTPPSGPSDNLGCSPDGYYHVDGATETTAGGSGKGFGSGASTANFAQCDKVLWVDGGHSVTRTWTFASPPRSGNVEFKVQKRRKSGDSTGPGIWYWFQSNISVNVPQSYHTGYRNADITFTCSYDKPTNHFDCTVTRVVL